MISPETISNTLITELPKLGVYKYVVLGLLAVIEGTWTTPIAGAMSSSGLLSPVPAFLVCVAGEITNGFLCYGIGRWLGAKPLARFMSRTESRRAMFEVIRHAEDRVIGIAVIVVKLTYSVATPVLLLVGSLRYDFRKFTILNIFGSLGWIIPLFWIGRLLGRSVVRYIESYGTLWAGFSVFVAIVLILWMVKVATDAITRRVQ